MSRPDRIDLESLHHSALAEAAPAETGHGKGCILLRMRRSLRRRLLLLLVLTPLLAIGAEALLWLFAGRQVEAAFHAWISARRAEGWRVSAGRESLAGWPFAAVVTVAGFAISGGENLHPGGLSWRTDGLALQLNLLAPRRLVLVPAGRQRIRLFGGPAIALVAARITAIIPLVAPNRVKIDAHDARFGAPDRNPNLVTARQITFDGSRASPGIPGPNPAADAQASERSQLALKLDATELAVPEARLPALGRKIALLSVSAVLKGPLPSGPSWAVGLGAWRGQGGTLAIRDLSLVWGPLAIGASGRLALDAAMQPAGQGTARIIGYTATLDALASEGDIGKGAATAAKAVLTLLARPSTTAGAPPEVDVPLRLEDRTVSVGQIPLFKLPAVTWPSGP